MIKRLTPDQEAYLPVFRQRWLDVGLNCEPADFATAEKIIGGFYRRIGKPLPLFLRFSSPMVCELATKLLRGQLWGQLWDQLWGQLKIQLWGQLWAQLKIQLWDQLHGELWDQLHGQLGDQIRGQIMVQLWDQIMGQLGDQLWDQIMGQLWAQLKIQLWDQLHGQLGDQLRDQIMGQLRDQIMVQLWGQLHGELWDQLHGQLGDQIRGQIMVQLWDQLKIQLVGQLVDRLWDQLRDQPTDQPRDQRRDPTGFYRTSFLGQHDIYWQAFYLFCREVGVEYKIDQNNLLEEWARLSKSCGWWMPYTDICIIADRQRFVSFDEQRRLHHESRLAVEFSDGWGVAAWHGQRVPSEWILDRSSLTAAVALKQENVELRRAACEILGWANVLEHPSLNPTVIDEDEPAIGTLVEIDLPDAPEQWFLRYRCATGRWFAEPVMDKRYNTALLANAAGNGWRPESGDNPMSYIPFIRT